MGEDSLKRKLYDNDSPVKKLVNSPIVKMAMVKYAKARTELEQNPRMRNDAKIGSTGLLIGIILGGLMATLSGSPTGVVTGIVRGSGGTGPGSRNPLINEIKGPGWNPVHVFYGKMQHFYDEIPERWYLKNDKKHTGKKSNEWFSQHGEDLSVATFFNFKKTGFFVDLASTDAVWASNTFALENNLNWKGICIEANPIFWYRLAFRTNCHVVGAVVGAKDFEEVQVQLPSDPKKEGPTGGIVSDKFDNKFDKVKVKDAETRYTSSLLTILKKFNAPRIIDYLSMDVEGAEEFILENFSFHHPYSFKVISIEKPTKVLEKKLLTSGYKKVMQFRGNDALWAHRSVYDSGKKNVEKRKDEIEKHKLVGEMPAALK